MRVQIVMKSFEGGSHNNSDRGLGFLEYNYAQVSLAATALRTQTEAALAPSPRPTQGRKGIRSMDARLFARMEELDEHLLSWLQG
jgi:hypothetical protein